MGWEPGASEDLRVRALTPTMAKVLGQPVVVVNKPGASSGIGLTLIAKAKPDGYTIGNSSVSGLLFAPHTNKVEYDTMHDFTYIASTGVQPYAVVVRSDAPWKNFNEFIDHVKKNPGTVKYGVAGIGGMVHVYMEILAKEWGLKWDVVPFKGDQPNVTALLGGHIPVCGNAICIRSTGEGREIPTPGVDHCAKNGTLSGCSDIERFGIQTGFEGERSFGYLRDPKGLSSEVVEKLENAIKQAVVDGRLSSVRLWISWTTSLNSETARRQRSWFDQLYPKIGNMIKEVGLKKQ